MIDKEMIAKFQKHILEWYALNKRDLPWRHTRDPYKIFVSEVMSQQTQLSRVIPKYLAWIEVFPSVEELAKAGVSDVLKYWSGLGYNRRALNMKKAAEKIVQEHNGIFPRTEKELLALPGIGNYTARAILCFAFDEQIAVVDTNVRKVILTQFLQRHSGEQRDSRILQLSDSGQARMTEREFEEIATQLLPTGHAYEWNQALMDFAASVLKKEKIPIPKQSKFHGSHRYYRGQILKQLLLNKKIAIKDLGPLIKKDYREEEREWLQKLLDELAQEGFITGKKGFIYLAS